MIGLGKKYVVRGQTQIRTLRLLDQLGKKGQFGEKVSYFSLNRIVNLSTDADSSTDTIGGWTKAKSAKKKIKITRRF